jgi:hypothetical protein
MAAWRLTRRLALRLTLKNSAGLYGAHLRLHSRGVTLAARLRFGLRRDGFREKGLFS